MRQSDSTTTPTLNYDASGRSPVSWPYIISLAMSGAGFLLALAFIPAFWLLQRTVYPAPDGEDALYGLVQVHLLLYVFAGLAALLLLPSKQTRPSCWTAGFVCTLSFVAAVAVIYLQFKLL